MRTEVELAAGAGWWRLAGVWVMWSVLVLPGWSQTNQTVYADALQNGWSSWGWASLNFNNGAPVHNGSASISVTSSNWQALYLHHAAQNSSGFSSLTFWVNGGSVGGQRIQVQATRNNVAQTAVVVASALPANAWRQETITLSSLGVAAVTDFDGFWIQVQNSGLAPTFYVDDITLVGSGTLAPTVTLTSPVAGTSYAAPALIPLAASVTANGHTLVKVQFYSGTNFLGEDVVAPYQLTWTNTTPGTYALTARLIYDSSNQVDSSAVTVTVTGTTPVSLSVDAQLNRHPISPLIYGTCFGSASQLRELNAPLNRWGGNSTTRYNWNLNADNKGNDWYFQSLARSSATPGAEADTFIGDTKNNGAEPLITVPMIGWMPKLGPNRGRLCSYSIAKYGPQTGNDAQWFPDAGNGISTTNNTPITWNDPTDANYETNAAFQQSWVRHLTNAWGRAGANGVRYYIMDNEHSLWHSTHRDVHPVGARMTEIRDKFFDYASVVKAVDPDALVAAPEEWGWNGYLYSGYDLWWADKNGWNVNNFPDRNANGRMDYMAWFLDQCRQRATNTNQRLLDIFTLHIYPQGSNESGTNVTPTVQNQRNRSTRALWDTNYVDQSWIGSVIKLIPRMKAWVAAYYPGTKLGITEYNWGAEDHINGATAQADLLGIFGREGLDLATRWTTPAASSPTFKAIKLFRNYDGYKSGFGDFSVAATGPNPDNVAVFAATRSTDGALTVIVVNKQLTTAATATLTLTNFFPGSAAQAWQLTAANAISRLADVSLTNRALTHTVPAQSITLYVIPAGAPPSPPSLIEPSWAGESLRFQLSGAPGHRYSLERSADLLGWVAFQTVSLTNSPQPCAVPATDAIGFFRARWVP